MRLWAKSEEEEFDTPLPDNVVPILKYTMWEDGAVVPTGVTIPGREPISSRRVEDARVRDDSGEWVDL